MSFPATVLATNLNYLAMSMDTSRNDKVSLSSILGENLELWVMFKTILNCPETIVEDDIKSNLIQLSDYVPNITMQYGEDIPTEQLDTLININRSIANGILGN